MTEQQDKNVADLTQYLRTHEAEFDMRYWYMEESGGCGSTMCIGGTLERVVNPTVFYKLRLDSQGDNSVVVGRMIGCSENDAFDLCYGLGVDLYEKYGRGLGLDQNEMAKAFADALDRWVAEDRIVSPTEVVEVELERVLKQRVNGTKTLLCEG